jgi:NAD(P)-dependent dehydrogenase (short-subunit alcohol dehydrogenase family)
MTGIPEVVLVTGASSGLGRATALALALAGCRVFGTSRHPERVRVPGVTLLPLDVRDPESVQACVDTVVARAGRLDALVNNAGYVGPAAATEELSVDQMRAVFETNVFGAMRVTDAVLPVMRQQGGGTIVNISSVAGRVAFPFFSPYVASKHALEGYTAALRHEVRPFGVRVALVAPGFFKSRLGASVEDPARPRATYAALRQRVRAREHFAITHGRDPRDVAHAVLRILRSPAPRRRYPVGLDAWVFALARRCLPDVVIERFVRWVTLEGEEAADPAAPALGPRRLLVDSEIADVLVPALVGAFLALGAALVGHRLRASRH